MGEPSPQIDSRVLGKILLIQTTLHSISSLEGLAEFACRGLEEMPGTQAVAVSIYDIFRSSSPSLTAQLLNTDPTAPNHLDTHEIKPKEPQNNHLLSTGIKTLHRAYGFIHLMSKDKEVLETYQPFLSSLANTIALTIENREHDRVLKQLNEDLSQANENLESLVQERTHELVATNKELMNKIEERRQTLAALQESEKKYREFADFLPQPVCELDRDGRLTFANQRCFGIFGYSQENFVKGLNAVDMISQADRKRAAANIQKILSGENLGGYEYTMRKKDGSVFPAIIFSSPIIRQNEPVGLRTIIIDITERKRAEESLQQAYKQLTSLFNGARDAIFIVDHATGLILDANDEATILLNFPRKTIIGLDHAKLHPPDKADFHRKRFLERSQLPSPDLEEAEVLTSDGRHVSVEISSRSIELSDGKRAMVAIFRDITDRKQMQDALRESEERFRLAYDTSPDAININRLSDGMYLDINEGFTHLTGYTREETIGRTSLEINLWCNPGDRGRLVQGLKEKGYYENLEADFRRKNGFVGTGLMSARVIVLKGVPHIISITRDITDRRHLERERRALEERLHRAEKMEALGTLAGGVAHDMNNVLGVLTGYSELLMEKIPEGSSFRSYAERIFSASEKGAAIIQDLLTMARRGVSSSDVININMLVDGIFQSPVLDKIKAYNSNVKFTKDLSADLLNVKGSAIHLEKTVLNLLSNAAEAISGEGAVTIKTENRYLDKPLPGYEQIREGDYVVLSVSDTGSGISRDDLEKIFEPFYTKKKMGRSGTGLGLAIVWGTVKDHEGYIDIKSTERKGTIFTLYFPVTREACPDKKQEIPMDQYSGKGESILVVDDVSEQRDVATTILTHLGYHVHGVSCGEDAVEYLKTNHADLLVLDMIMEPGMDGLETYQRILAINPKQKAILVSGFSETERVREAQTLGAGAYVKKPYVMEKIGVAIRDELNR
jgi:two-component system cell cycle sensor histidine kinase/response regulator CckA